MVDICLQFVLTVSCGTTYVHFHNEFLLIFHWSLQPHMSSVLVGRELLEFVFKVPMWWNVRISQMVDSYILALNNDTLRIVAPGTNGYFEINVVTYKRVWHNFEFKFGLNDPYGK